MELINDAPREPLLWRELVILNWSPAKGARHRGVPVEQAGKRMNEARRRLRGEGYVFVLGEKNHIVEVVAPPSAPALSPRLQAIADTQRRSGWGARLPAHAA